MNNLSLIPYRARPTSKRSVTLGSRVPLLLSAIFFASAGLLSATPPSRYGFYTVTPCRVVDTRNAPGPYGGPAIQSNSDRSFVIVGRCGVPTTASAVALNVTITNATTSGNIRIYPEGSPLPLSSTVNYLVGKPRANNGSYRLGSTGALSIHSDQSTGSAHLILDVSGYFESPDFAEPPPPPPASLWSKEYSGSGSDSGKSVVVDDAGNVVIGGQYQGIINFGTGAVTSYTIAVSGPTPDAFVAKYSASGAALWSRGMGGDGSDSAYAVATDPSGSVLVTGYQGSTSADYGGGLLGSRGQSDIFVAKYSSTGGYLWAKTMGSTGSDIGTGVAADGTGNVYVLGQFSLSVDFGGGSLTSAGSNDVCLVKYSSTGGHMWSKRFGSTGVDLGGPISVDVSGNVLIAGTFDGTIDLGGGPLTSGGGRDLFAAKFSSSGQHLWSKRFGGTSTEFVRGLAVDGAGDLVLTGQFLSSINFGGTTLTSAGYEDVFLAKLSGATGGHIWSKRFGSSSTTDAGYGVAVDGSGNVAITGYFAQTVDFGGGNLFAQGYDIFVAKYSSSGAYISARRLGDPAMQFETQAGDAIAMSSGGSMYLLGHFVGSLDLGGAGSMTSALGGGVDAFLASIGP